MNAVKTRLAQFMDFLPWTTLRRVIQRYGGDRGGGHWVGPRVGA
jgi:hypothetical protein